MPLVTEFNDCVELLVRTHIRLDLGSAVDAAAVIEELANEALEAVEGQDLKAQPIIISDVHRSTDNDLKLKLHQIPVSWPSLVREAVEGKMTLFGPDGLVAM